VPFIPFNHIGSTRVVLEHRLVDFCDDSRFLCGHEPQSHHVYSCVCVLQSHGVGVVHHGDEWVGRHTFYAHCVDEGYVFGSGDGVDELCEDGVDGQHVDVHGVCVQISHHDDDYE